VISGEKIVPELIQNGATPDTIASAMSAYIDSPPLYAGTVEKLGALREKLGEKTPSMEVAKAICSFVPKLS
jgi:lipid A disaccharide synthetase